MKRKIVILLALVMILSLTACKKKTVVEDPTLPPVTETEPIVLPPEEVIPDIEIETLPPAITDEMTGADLSTLYKTFLNNYDWSAHNGFTAKMSSEEITVLWDENTSIIDLKRYSINSTTSYFARCVQAVDGAVNTLFVMNDMGSQATVTEFESAQDFSDRRLRFTNANTTSHYQNTILGETIIDVIAFSTPLEATEPIQNQGATVVTQYFVHEAGNPESMFMIEEYSDGTWGLVGPWASKYNNKAESYDTTTGVLTLSDKSIQTTLVTKKDKGSDNEDADNAPAEQIQATVLNGEAYIDRLTQKVLYIKDMDTHLTVYPLSQDSVNFEIPTNTLVTDAMTNQDAALIELMNLFGTFIDKYVATVNN